MCLISNVLFQVNKRPYSGRDKEGSHRYQKTGNEIQQGHKGIGTGKSALRLGGTGFPNFMFP